MESFLSIDFILFYEQSFCIMLCEVERGQTKKGPIHSSGHITGHPLPSGTLSWRWHSPYEERSKQLLSPSLGIPSDPPILKNTCKYVLNAPYWFRREILKIWQFPLLSEGTNNLKQLLSKTHTLSQNLWKPSFPLSLSSLLWDFGRLDPAPNSASGIDCWVILNKSLPSASVPYLPNGVAMLFLQIFLHTDSWDSLKKR